MSSECTCRKALEFRDVYHRVEPDDGSCLKCFRCNKKRAKNCINSLVPSYRIMKKYQWKTDFAADIICGLTVGIMQLPQGKTINTKYRGSLYFVISGKYTETQRENFIHQHCRMVLDQLTALFHEYGHYNCAIINLR